MNQLSSTNYEDTAGSFLFKLQLRSDSSGLLKAKYIYVSTCGTENPYIASVKAFYLTSKNENKGKQRIRRKSQTHP